MADTIKSSDELKIEFGFADYDTRTVTLPDPKSSVAKADIKALETLAVSTKPIIGDKGGADVVGINRAKVYEKTEIKLDLS